MAILQLQLGLGTIKDEDLKVPRYRDEMTRKCWVRPGRKEVPRRRNPRRVVSVDPVGNFLAAGRTQRDFLNIFLPQGTGLEIAQRATELADPGVYSEPC